MDGTFVLRIDLGNDAFEEDPQMEVARILRHICDDVESGGWDAETIRDSNGNTVGFWEFSLD